MRFFITGTAGFISSSRAETSEPRVISWPGFDAMTSYYDVALKPLRAPENRPTDERVSPGDSQLEDMDLLMRSCAEAEPEIIIHLAAQAGVRYSLENPRSYVNSDLCRFDQPSRGRQGA